MLTHGLWLLVVTSGLCTRVIQNIHSSRYFLFTKYGVLTCIYCLLSCFSAYFESDIQLLPVMALIIVHLSSHHGYHGITTCTICAHITQFIFILFLSYIKSLNIGTLSTTYAIMDTIKTSQHMQEILSYQKLHPGYYTG